MTLMSFHIAVFVLKMLLWDVWVVIEIFIVSSALSEYIQGCILYRNRHIWRAHWSSGSTLNHRSRGLWSKSYTGPTWISLGTRNEFQRLHSTKVWIGTLRGHCLSQQVWYYWVWNSFPRETQTLFLCSPMIRAS